jgi:hypothetical protein
VAELGPFGWPVVPEVYRITAVSWGSVTTESKTGD